MRPLIPAGGACNFYGDSKTGKSYNVLQLCVALTGAIPDWHGFPLAQTGPVLYVQLDTPRSLWMERLEEVQGAGYDLGRIHFADRETFDAWPFDILRPEHFSRLREEVARVQPVAVVIDTLRESNSAKENEATEMQVVVARLVAATRPAALILVSHSRKANFEAGPDLINDNRGSNYIAGRMDAIIRQTKKGITFIGRQCEEGTIKLKRQECGMWEVEVSELDTHLAAVLADTSLSSTSAQARALASRTGKTEEACRAVLKRRKSGRKEGVGGGGQTPDLDTRVSRPASEGK